MLDAYVIEEIKRREREQTRDERPSVELPITIVPTKRQDRDEDERPDDRGVVIIDYS